MSTTEGTVAALIEMFQLAWRVLRELKGSREELERARRATLVGQAAAAKLRAPAPPRAFVPKPPRPPKPPKAKAAPKPPESLVGREIGALKVLAYVRPGQPLNREAPSPWWRCVCLRCKVEQEHQGHALRNRVPSCRSCGLAS